MKTILVTGANGFIGRALTKKLTDKKYNVMELNSSDGDISVIDLIKKYSTIHIDYIFHLASRTFVPDSWDDPISFYKTSVIGTNNILELCRNKNIALTFVSAYLYGAPVKLPISEDDPIQPNNHYANSKYMAENLCKFYSEQHDLKVTIARPFNIYGKEQKENFLIPYIIDQVLNSSVIKVKDLQPKRDYVYLDDFINGLLNTIESKEKFSVYNFGSGIELSVKEVINIVQKIENTNKKIYSEEIERKNEIMNVVADISKAKENLNWVPNYTFEEGILEIIKDIKNGKK
ncbi:MAG: NAD-dependent epimerase/dehydratase family protein [Poseidonibacter sp.]|uniref:NAD-dependent epimerase/dehydratase family protein n=1 Tax=Poseidonibacter sp. TaxID=2321188 RepID=UPI00359D630F